MDISFFDLHYAVNPESLIPMPSIILLSFGRGTFRDSVSADHPSGPSWGGDNSLEGACVSNTPGALYANAPGEARAVWGVIPLGATDVASWGVFTFSAA
jgi:hypothetical protein